jgi:hypothetical protein
MCRLAWSGDVVACKMAPRTFELLRDLAKPPIHCDESSEGHHFNFAG